MALALLIHNIKNFTNRSFGVIFVAVLLDREEDFAKKLKKYINMILEYVLHDNRRYEHFHLNVVRSSIIIPLNKGGNNG